jgi:GNAT superfamily N-acetyltransferase
LPDASIGAAEWLLPRDKATSDAQSKANAAFLAEAIGAQGSETYHRMVDFMPPRVMGVVARSAWYLSIVGVAPSAQGQGIGARLLEPTLAEADAAGVPCYLETLDNLNPCFFRRLGFSAVGTHRGAHHAFRLHHYESPAEVEGAGHSAWRVSRKLPLATGRYGSTRA